MVTSPPSGNGGMGSLGNAALAGPQVAEREARRSGVPPTSASLFSSPATPTVVPGQENTAMGVNVPGGGSDTDVPLAPSVKALFARCAAELASNTPPRAAVGGGASPLPVTPHVSGASGVPDTAPPTSPLPPDALVHTLCSLATTVGVQVMSGLVKAAQKDGALLCRLVAESREALSQEELGAAFLPVARNLELVTSGLAEAFRMVSTGAWRSAQHQDLWPRASSTGTATGSGSQAGGTGLRVKGASSSFAAVVSGASPPSLFSPATGANTLPISSKPCMAPKANPLGQQHGGVAASSGMEALAHTYLDELIQLRIARTHGAPLSAPVQLRKLSEAMQAHIYSALGATPPTTTAPVGDLRGPVYLQKEEQWLAFLQGLQGSVTSVGDIHILIKMAEEANARKQAAGEASGARENPKGRHAGSAVGQHAPRTRPVPVMPPKFMDYTPGLSFEEAYICELQRVMVPVCVASVGRAVSAVQGLVLQRLSEHWGSLTAAQQTAAVSAVNMVEISPLSVSQSLSQALFCPPLKDVIRPSDQLCFNCGGKHCAEMGVPFENCPSYPAGVPKCIHSGFVRKVTTRCINLWWASLVRSKGISSSPPDAHAPWPTSHTSVSTDTSSFPELGRPAAAQGPLTTSSSGPPARVPSIAGSSCPAPGGQQQPEDTSLLGSPSPSSSTASSAVPLPQGNTPLPSSALTSSLPAGSTPSLVSTSTPSASGMISPPAPPPLKTSSSTTQPSADTAHRNNALPSTVTSSTRAAPPSTQPNGTTVYRNSVQPKGSMLHRHRPAHAQGQPPSAQPPHWQPATSPARKGLKGKVTPPQSPARGRARAVYNPPVGGTGLPISGNPFAAFASDDEGQAPTTPAGRGPRPASVTPSSFKRKLSPEQPEELQEPRGGEADDEAEAGRGGEMKRGNMAQGIMVAGQGGVGLSRKHAPTHPTTPAAGRDGGERGRDGAGGHGIAPGAVHTVPLVGQGLDASSSAVKPRTREVPNSHHATSVIAGSGHSSVFLTDGEIAARGKGSDSPRVRQPITPAHKNGWLPEATAVPWSPADELLQGGGSKGGSLSSNGGTGRRVNHPFNQFATYTDMTGNRSTYDPSFYTTPLDLTSYSPEQLQEADRLARRGKGGAGQLSNSHVSEDSGLHMEASDEDDGVEEARYHDASVAPPPSPQGNPPATPAAKLGPTAGSAGAGRATPSAAASIPTPFAPPFTPAAEPQEAGEKWLSAQLSAREASYRGMSSSAAGDLGAARLYSEHRHRKGSTPGNSSVPHAQSSAGRATVQRRKSLEAPLTPPSSCGPLAPWQAPIPLGRKRHWLLKSVMGPDADSHARDKGNLHQYGCWFNSLLFTKFSAGELHQQCLLGKGGIDTYHSILTRMLDLIPRSHVSQPMTTLVLRAFVSILFRASSDTYSSPYSQGDAQSKHPYFSLEKDLQDMGDAILAILKAEFPVQLSAVRRAHEGESADTVRDLLERWALDQQAATLRDVPTDFESLARSMCWEVVLLVTGRAQTLDNAARILLGPLIDRAFSLDSHGKVATLGPVGGGTLCSIPSGAYSNFLTEYLQLLSRFAMVKRATHLTGCTEISEEVFHYTQNTPAGFIGRHGSDAAEGRVANEGEFVARQLQAHMRSPEASSLVYPPDIYDHARRTSAGISKLMCPKRCAGCVARENITIRTDVSEVQSMWLSLFPLGAGNSLSFAKGPVAPHESALKHPPPVMTLLAVDGVFAGKVGYSTDLSVHRHGGDDTMGHFVAMHVGVDARRGTAKVSATDRTSSPVSYGVLFSDDLSQVTEATKRAQWMSPSGPADGQKGETGVRLPSLLQAAFTLQQCRPFIAKPPHDPRKSKLRSLDADGSVEVYDDDATDFSLSAVNYTVVPLDCADCDTTELLEPLGLLPSAGRPVPANWRDIFWVSGPSGQRAPVLIANFETVTVPAHELSGDELLRIAASDSPVPGAPLAAGSYGSSGGSRAPRQAARVLAGVDRAAYSPNTSDSQASCVVMLPEPSDNGRSYAAGPGPTGGGGSTGPASIAPSTPSHSPS